MKNKYHIITMVILVLNLLHYEAFTQQGNRIFDVAPSSISIPANIPNKAKFKDMVGVNEVGYIFWDHVYNSTLPAGHTVVRSSVADAFKSTFPKIRLFHDNIKDYNVNGQTWNTPTGFTSTLPTCNSTSSRDNFCALKNFYRVLRPDYSYISTAPMALKNSFPDLWFSASEWGTSEANRKEEAYLYAKAFLQNMDPTPTSNPKTNLVDRFYTSNEAWGNLLGSTSYKSISDGFLEGFTEYYQGNRLATPNQSLWNIKVWLGAFQANDSNNSWPSDYIANNLSVYSKNNLYGIDIHPYAFFQNTPTNNSLFINQHPESDSSFFMSIKNLTKWRDDQTGNADTFKLSASEFGWNSSDIYKRWPFNYTNSNDGQPTTAWVMKKKGADTGSTQPLNPNDWDVENYGIGEEAQAIYSTRAYLMFARYGFESAYLYGTLNNEEVWFGTSGAYRTNIDTIKLVGTNSNFFKFNVTIYGEGANEAFASPAGEKKIMPAMRKLRDNAVIGDKVYMQTLVENNNGVYAYLVGSGTGTPTHLVAWHAKKINNQTESQILANTITKTITEINLPSNLSISIGSNYTRLDWNPTINNILPSSVFNSTTGVLTLSPIPIVIPLTPSCTTNVTNAGTITGNQTICMPYNPTNITSSAAASGGAGLLSYIWESSTSTTPSTFTVIAGATAATYDPPTNISVNTYYRRGAIRAGCTNYLFTGIVNKLNNNVTNVGAVAADQTVCGTGGVTNKPALFTNISSATGGTVQYKWDKSTTSATGPFTIIAGATSSTYDPPLITATTWYRRLANNTSCATSLPSAPVKVTYNTSCSFTDIAVTFTEKCVLPNGNIRMKVRANNIGTTNVSNLVITFTGLCAGYSPSGTAAPNGTTYDPGFCPSFPQKWTIPTINSGTNLELTLEYYLAIGAIVSATHTTAGDINAGNNTASFTNSSLPTCSISSTDLAVSFSSKCVINGNVKMGVTVNNLGTTTLTNAVVTFTGLCTGYNSAGNNVPAGTNYDPGFCPNFPQTWTITSLAPGASSTLVIEYYLNPGVTITASNTTAGDGNTTNNTNSFVNPGLATCVNGSGTAGRPSLVEDISQLQAEISPNPFNESLNVIIQSKDFLGGQIELISTSGQLLLSAPFDSQASRRSHSLDTSTIPLGIYLVRITSDNQPEIVKKVVKSN
jgi:hypothetical protein